MTARIIGFPAERTGHYPTLTTGFPAADAGIVRGIDPRDRTVYDLDAVEVTDDETDEFVALPIRVGAHYGEPCIEVGKYSMGLDDARRLAAIVGKFAAGFREVAL